MKIQFYKYQGTGNDFVMVDNRGGNFNYNNAKFISSICDRRYGIGCDGLILIEDNNDLDFTMKYFNSDGSELGICGNGARCVTQFAKKLGIKEGLKLKKPLLEYYYKEDSLDDPMISRDHLITFGWATNSELKKIDKMSLQINKHLRNLFFKKNIILVDFKIEFGRLSSNPKKIVLADEISPDSCRLWDKKTNKKLDKDVFRRNLGSLLSAYEEVASRLGIVH